MTPVFGFAAKSGTGKTTLMEQVIAVLKGLGYRVAALKHGHHMVDPDIPGKDSHRFRTAGAETVLFVGPGRWFMIQERDDPTLEHHLARLAGHDLILVEGYRDGPYPKILIHRGQHSSGLDKEVTHIVAVASDDPNLSTPVPLLPLNDPQAVAQFIVDHLGLTSQSSP